LGARTSGENADQSDRGDEFGSWFHGRTPPSLMETKRPDTTEILFDFLRQNIGSQYVIFLDLRDEFKAIIQNPAFSR
jgi:hypothetical protein